MSDHLLFLQGSQTALVSRSTKTMILISYYPTSTGSTSLTCGSSEENILTEATPRYSMIKMLVSSVLFL